MSMLKLVSHSPRLNARLEKARHIMEEKNLDVLIVFKPVNLFYLTGFRGTSGALAVFPDKAALLVDSRYEERAEREAANVEIWGGKNVRTALKDMAVEIKAGRIGFESNGLTYDEYEEMAASFASVTRSELMPVKNAIETVRAIKDAGEIASLTEAAKLADDCMEMLVGEIRPGVTEKELAYLAEYQMRENGAEGESFEIIVASGANSSMPHASSTDKRVERGDLVLIDLGAVKDGYCSDITRTFAVGKARPEQKAMYAAVLEAGGKTLAELKAGTGAAEADDFCRSLLEGSGAPGKFLHSLGHGVGLEIHEFPQLGSGSKDVLAKDMVFTIEPGLYSRGTGGVRIEDMILLDDEPRPLTRFPKGLIEL